jgi:hypothetical protein
MNLSQLENAIIDLPVKGGRGVLIAGGMILTAAHCISCTCSSRMVLLEDNLVKVRIKNQLIYLNILFVDPVSDIAVLGKLTDQSYEHTAFFEAFCSTYKPFKINKSIHVPLEPISLNIYNENRQWVNASGEIASPDSHIICITADSLIKPGASGGPIINNQMELISINSQFSLNNKDISGFAALPLLTLPKWILNRMR